MIKKEYTIINPVGLHARPAAHFVDIVSKYKAKTTIIFDDIEVNAKSIISVLSLGLGQGDTFQLVIDGPDEEELLIKIEDYLYKHICRGKGSYNDIIRQDFEGFNK